MRGGLSGADRRGNEPPRFWTRRRSGDAGLGLLSGHERGGSPAAVRRRSDGWAPHARQGRSSSGEPLMLARAAYARQSRLRSAAPLASRRGRSCRTPSIAARCRGRVARGLFPGACPIGGYLQPGAWRSEGVRARPVGSHEHRSPFPHLASMASSVDRTISPVGGTMRLGASAARSLPRRRPLRHVFCDVFCFCTSSAFALRRTGSVFTGGGEPPFRLVPAAGPPPQTSGRARRGRPGPAPWQLPVKP
jgi:hypothetical protein